MKNEIWKDIIGYEGLYKISSYGNIKSLPKNAGNSHRKEKAVKTKIDKYGYEQIKLSKNNKRKYFTAHRLTALTFIKNPDSKKQVNHIDGDKLNNNINNLEWVTDSENKKHGFKIGLYVPKNGEKSNFSKLKKEDVLWIRENKGKYTVKEMAKKYNTCASNIYLIISNKTWKEQLK